MDVIHTPVLLEEVTANIIKDDTELLVDATVGGAGHSYHILEKHRDIRLIGIDMDEVALEVAREKLSGFKERVRLIRGNFKDLKGLLQGHGIYGFDAIIFDLGISTFQIMGRRGFSFHDDVFMDMRMDIREKTTGYDVVNFYDFKRLLSIIRDYGEERKAHKIAKAIVEARKIKPINTSYELGHIVSRVKRKTGKIHPATKTFQAIRIEVNRELENLREGLLGAIEMLNKGGRIGVISFHSLEDRIVKNTFKDSPSLVVITKKPITPGREEIARNPNARSAKLRVAEKL
ncbi:MAG: 16S rRNA (cytosine(1402)-N(4))-methyltransferase RsmH [Syntrophorhabdaceae bacterium]|nr:16S rRNA (cytosine(1402)-N(4))-methyltransferase RsmH [Syntrophorhabdaceae bacterium]